jgi:hypothetical protein
MKGAVYGDCSELTTSQLLDELIECELLDGTRPHRQLMHSVVRACSSLCSHGLLESEYTDDTDAPGRTTVSWKAVK